MDEEIFQRSLQEIFDLAHSSSLQRADVKDEDKEFLRSQREDRGESSMAGIDLVQRRSGEAGRARELDSSGSGNVRQRHCQADCKGRKSQAKAVAAAAVPCRRRHHRLVVPKPEEKTQTVAIDLREGS
ncbi:hypothetical protein GWK47_033832 [Chionoecetes opilio]|uniref:Uncharacterized protein n=1 Tax=Chionoecetes opilio TaxID=41210 RepID=A0A8J5D0Z5_CHIOP|nr:hypothetical protein GWK47_033832 [Chionoecetes opilio]